MTNRIMTPHIALDLIEVEQELFELPQKVFGVFLFGTPPAEHFDVAGTCRL